MKKLILFFILFCITNTTYAYTIKAGISLTVNEARTISFENVTPQIDISKYKKYFFDKNYKKNQNALKKGKYRYQNKYLTLFSNNSYAITYLYHKEIGFYYNSNGHLILIEYDLNKNYPVKRVRYDINGNLDSVSLSTSNKEDFIFDINKKLIAHWIGNNCYNEKGELTKTRY